MPRVCTSVLFIIKELLDDDDDESYYVEASDDDLDTIRKEEMDKDKELKTIMGFVFEELKTIMGFVFGLLL